ncbi:2-amino-3,7-dideoxy-D-threo-hept-6-ulosonate synthase [Hamadaea sp. NPDC051192]|uniref:2-amino-3,7-dideoxy-D-threo-hept-6-ulosonate synthase n=1 Tax=Hamadaea sp. NPDC051192 TaxID=3154940 RepID=UPI00342796B8
MSGRELRLRRLFRHGPRLLAVPLDHAVTDGPIVPRGDLNALVGELTGNGADAIVVHRGGAARLAPGVLGDAALIVHLSASTRHAPDPDAKYLVAGVDSAVRLGADAVSVHVNLGAREERQQVADLARVADECDRWQLPLLAMIYPRGPEIANPRDPALIAHAATLAADLGADIVKTPYAGEVDAMADVVASCPIPLIVAGGARLNATGEILAFVDDALAAGTAGLAMGRNIFQAPDAGHLTRLIAQHVHGVREEALT